MLGPVSICNVFIRRFRLVAVLLVVVAAMGTRCRGEIILYEDSVSQLPGDQPWMTYGSNSLLTGGVASQTSVPGIGVTLTTDRAVSAGYSNHTLLGSLKNAAFPVLDRNSGYSVGFELKVNSESHSSEHRSGFSATVIGHDLRGIELGFWTDRIWAQSQTPLFSHAEETLFDTSLKEVTYRLAFLGNSYTLFGDNVQLLTGSLRDYSAFGNPPYTLPNFLFFGDNTSQAAASVTLGNLSVSTVPEPNALSGAVMLTAGLLLTLVVRRRSSRNAAIRSL